MFDVEVYDINSSYPFQLATRRLPYGEPVIQYGEGQHPDMSKFWVAQALVRFEIKHGHQPCIPLKAITEGRPVTHEHWIESSEGLVRMSFCNIDYLTILRNYDFKVVHWEWSIHWAWKIQKEVASFILENNTKKVELKRKAKIEPNYERAKEYLIQSNRAKIDNNAFYGKFGEDIIKRGKTPYLEDDDVVYKCDREDILPERKRRFLPLAIATTAWGRSQLMEAVEALGEYFIYCDTDSVHFLKTAKEMLESKIDIDPVKLGSWDHEASFKFGRYLRSKCYMEGDLATNEFDVTLAGLPADPHTGMGSKKRSCCTRDNFHIGLFIPGGNGKLRTVRTRTGNKLVPTDFEIKEYSFFA